MSSTQFFSEKIAGLSFWKDGEILNSSEAGIAVWDHGFLYGDGVFEGLRLRARHIYRVHEHLRRLRRSAAILKLDVQYSNDQLIEAIKDVAHSNHLDDAHIRLVLTRGVGMPSLDPRHCPTPTTLILAYPFPPTLGEDPIKLATSSVVRKAPRSVDPAAKSLNYLDAILAKIQAIAAGAHDALLLDGEGLVAEATGANIFGVTEGAIFTPECTAALPGITRRAVIELARLNQIRVAERRVTLGELYAADEVFVTGSGAGIVPIAEIDGRALPDPPGEVTRMIKELYARTWTDSEYSVSI